MNTTSGLLNEDAAASHHRREAKLAQKQESIRTYCTDRPDTLRALRTCRQVADHTEASRWIAGHVHRTFSTQMWAQNKLQEEAQRAEGERVVRGRGFVAHAPHGVGGVLKTGPGDVQGVAGHHVAQPACGDGPAQVAVARHVEHRQPRVLRVLDGAPLLRDAPLRVQSPSPSVLDFACACACLRLTRIVGYQGFVVKKRNSARGSMDTAPHPVGG